VWKEQMTPIAQTVSSWRIKLYKKKHLYTTIMHLSHDLGIYFFVYAFLFIGFETIHCTPITLIHNTKCHSPSTVISMILGIINERGMRSRFKFAILVIKTQSNLEN
jgi:hypothetical protein